MRHCSFIAATEAFTIVVPCARRDVRMTVLITVVYVGPAVIVEVFTCSLDAVVVALALNVAELLGRNVPTSWSLSVGRCGRAVGLSHCETGRGESEKECRYCKLFNFMFEPPCMVTHR